MIPTITIFGREISTYGIAALVGILVMGTFAYIKSKKNGLDEVKMVFILLFSAIGVLIGGHILYGITMIPYMYMFQYITNFDELILVFSTIFGGQVFYGGLLGGIAAACIYAKASHTENFSGYTDIMAVGAPLFHFFGRIGCFLGGCCYGIEYDGPLAIHFNYNELIPALSKAPRFPVQFAEAGFNLLLAAVLLVLLNKKVLKGKLFIMYLGIYAVGRFILEFFRGDNIRGHLLGLSTSQIVSVLILVFILIFTAINLIKSKNRIKTI